MKKLLFSLIFLIINSVLIAQNLNSYKYIIIPNKYDFLKFDDQYKLNSLTKFLFEKENFNVYFSNDKIPAELYHNECLGLNLKLIKGKSLFSTSLTIILKNCNNEFVYKSNKGTSKLKDYKKGYHEALRKAFASIKSLNYEYNDEQLTNKSINTTKQIINKINKSKKEKPIDKKNIDLILYAQKIKNGYQLSDRTAVKYVILNSGLKNVYHIKNSNGIIYKKNNEWFFEINVANKINITKLNIKF